MNHLFNIYIAYILDLLIGDPHWFPHPVRGIGFTINLLETITVKLFGRNIFAGIITGLLTLFITISFVFASIYIANLANPIFGEIITIFWLWAGFSAQSLAKSAKDVLKHLKSGNICEARKALSMIVGRDTEDLDKTQISRAVIETVSENAVDGIIAPLFFAAIGGAPLLWAFKSISTCDSMIGYKNKRYRTFGTFSAKLDDVANYIPARLSLLLYPIAAWIGDYDSASAYKTARRDASIHSSPNAGIPEAATAGALRISLGGDAVYGGELHKKELFGKEFPPPNLEDINKTIDLMWTVTAIMLLSIIAIVLLAPYVINSPASFYQIFQF